MGDKTKVEAKRRLEIIGAGLSANIEDLAFYDDTFGATFSMWFEVPIDRLEEIGRFATNTCKGFDEEIPEEIYDKKWKVTIEELEGE